MTFDELVRQIEEPIKRYEPQEPQEEGGKWFCPLCGKHLKKKNQYCSGCGQRLNWIFAFDTIGLNKEVIFQGQKYFISEIEKTHELGGTTRLKIEALEE